MEKLLFILLLLCPLLTFAKCNNLAEFLVDNYPNRVFVESFGYDGTYAVFEPSLNENKSNVFIFECKGEKYQEVEKIPFLLKELAGLDFSDKDKKLFIYFEYETEQYGCCLLYTSPSPRDLSTSRMPSSA